jgi:hypothetical protein
MKKAIIALFALTSTCLLLHADTSLTAYGTYWEGDDIGKGAGLRLKKTILGFGAIEGRGGYVEFSDTNTDVVPLDVSLNLRLPFMISPYAGVGAGYYLIDSNDLSGVDDESGYFAQLGIEATFIWIGAMAEIRWHDIEGGYLDGHSVNVGLLVKW